MENLKTDMTPLSRPTETIRTKLMFYGKFVGSYSTANFVCFTAIGLYTVDGGRKIANESIE